MIFKKQNYHYNKDELKKALSAVGVNKGDIIFSHVGMGFLGYPQEGKDLKIMFDVILSAFLEVLGPGGNFIVPTYTYSFCKGKDFDPANSASTVGFFTEEFRKKPGVRRSLDPIFSVAGIGPKIKELFENLPDDCFGQDCIYDRLKKINAQICNIGVGFQFATFVHYAEESAGVPYRFKKIFRGRLINGPERTTKEVIYYVRNAEENLSTLPDLSRLERDANSSGRLAKAKVGLGFVTNIDCRSLFDLCLAGIKSDPWYLAKGYGKNHT